LLLKKISSLLLAKLGKFIPPNPHRFESLPTIVQHVLLKAPPVGGDFAN
jgi:hypothetical protein